MKILLLLLLIGVGTCSLRAQDKDTWYIHYNNDSTLIGYKDVNGHVTVTPKFSGLISAARFDHIIGVTEHVDGQWKNYYLTKSGRVAGRDSLFSYDNMSDCESEGFIRFHDTTADRIGLFDRHGNLTVPARYNALSNVKNGMLSGLKDAKKTYWGNPATDGEHAHFTWKGGREVLIDTADNMLIADFPGGHQLDFYSVQKSKTPSADKKRVSFPAVEGDYYSFIDFEQEFDAWLKDSLINNLHPQGLTAMAFDTIIWDGAEDWEKADKQTFVTQNFDLIKASLLKAVADKKSYAIFIDGLNPFLYEGPTFARYFNNCGSAKEWQYPVMKLVHTYDNGGDTAQNHFEFLRTANGYRLVAVSIRNGQVVK